MVKSPPISEEVKAEIDERAKGRCEICGLLPDWRGGNYHHNPPKGMGGSKRIYTANMILFLCERCHTDGGHIGKVKG